MSKYLKRWEPPKRWWEALLREELIAVASLEDLYLLIEPDEDGNPVRFYNREQLMKRLDELAKSGEKTRWRDWPNELGDDPNYWDENTKMILKVQVVKPKPKSVAVVWEVD